MTSAAQILQAEFGSDIVALPESGSAPVTDWSGVPGATPQALLRPRDTAQVAALLAACQRHRLPVVPQGGLTGLVGGGAVSEGAVALSLERMRAIEEIDAVSGTMTVQAGALLQTVQEAADAAGLYFPLDLGARGSCTIGGNLATNAGGNRVIRYGMMRDQVLGIEAVLADGTVVSELHKMIKNNAGYDLKNLLIGSEGTLAVITRAVLRLRAKPGAVCTAWCGLPDYKAVTTLLRRAQSELAAGVSAFEVMWPSYYDFVLANIPSVRRPLAGTHGFYVLLESTGGDAVRQGEEFEALLARLHEEGVLEDAAVAASHAAARAFWAVRDATGEIPRMLPNLAAFDVGFAIADVESAASRCADALRRRWPDATALFYGHLGDGNLHVMAHVSDDPHDLAEVDRCIYEIVAGFGGTISAEHGIGSKKRTYLGQSRGAAAIAAMRSIKTALDPAGLLNPGKVL